MMFWRSLFLVAGRWNKFEVTRVAGSFLKDV